MKKHLVDPKGKTNVYMYIIIYICCWQERPPVSFCVELELKKPLTEHTVLFIEMMGSVIPCVHQLLQHFSFNSQIFSGPLLRVSLLYQFVQFLTVSDAAAPTDAAKQIVLSTTDTEGTKCNPGYKAL